MKRYGGPEVVVTDKLRSYGAAMKVVGKKNRKLAVASIIGLRIPTWRFDEESEQCCAFDERKPRRK